MLGHPVFRDKIREWLKVLRKANCVVVLATQSLTDAARSGILDVLVESCPTKIFLPNPNAPAFAAMYEGMGVNGEGVEMIAAARPKRHYILSSPTGRRVCDLALGRTALAFCAASSRRDVARIKKLQSELGDRWVDAWLSERQAPALDGSHV